MHPNTNEFQYILEGTGTIWLGDKEVRVKPGDLIIIPKGTPHAGTKPDGAVFKAIAIKTPPQGPQDTRCCRRRRSKLTPLQRSWAAIRAGGSRSR